MLTAPDRLNGRHPPPYSLIQGDSAGHPVVLVHGIASSVHSWEALQPTLLESGCRTYALDLLGHGNSPKPAARADYDIHVLYAHTRDWLLSLPLGEPVTLIAHSLGGYVALLFALEFPERLARLVLIDPFYCPEQLSSAVRLGMRRPKLAARFLEAAPLWAVSPVVRWNNNVTANLSEDAKLQMALDYKRAHPNILHIAPSAPDLSPRLGALDVETLVVWGEDDRTLHPDSFPRLMGLLPRASAFPIEHAGHVPQLTHAEVTRLAVVSFLNA
jgi:pimeloyl-ACP methyl ester carboxylesterase